MTAATPTLAAPVEADARRLADLIVDQARLHLGADTDLARIADMIVGDPDAWWRQAAQAAGVPTPSAATITQVCVLVAEAARSGGVMTAPMLPADPPPLVEHGDGRGTGGTVAASRPPLVDLEVIDHYGVQLTVRDHMLVPGQRCVVHTSGGRAVELTVGDAVAVRDWLDAWIGGRS